MSELAAIKSVQKEMLEVQNRNWQIIEKHFKVFQDIFHGAQFTGTILI